MKQLKSIFLIVCLVGPYLGIFIYLKHEQKMLKRQVKHMLIEGVDRSELVELTFTKDEVLSKLNWEHAGEFEYNGEMYDVVESEYANGKITYWCWWDHKETSLNKQLNAMVAKILGDDTGSGEKNKPTISFLEMDLILNPEVPFKIAPMTYQEGLKPPYNQGIIDFAPHIPVPPPRA